MAGGLEDALKAKLRAIPAMSGTATKLLALLKNPNTNATQIEAVVRYDPGLTANILKLANSAYFGVFSIRMKRRREKNLSNLRCLFRYCTAASFAILWSTVFLFPDTALCAWDGSRSSSWW